MGKFGGIVEFDFESDALAPTPRLQDSPTPRLQDSKTPRLPPPMKSDILLVGQTPPPFHGQSVVTGMLFDHDWGDLEVVRLRMAYSDSIDDVGKAGIGKVLHLLSLIFQTWMMVVTKRPKILYYLPASPNMAPVVRDFLYLASVRWLFSKTVFHYHAGGLDDYIREKKCLRRFVKWVYNGADCSIDVNVTEPASGEYFKAKQNIVVMNGLDVGAAKRQRGDDGVFQILYLGLLCEPKGVIGLVDTARQLKKSKLDCQFVMVGGWESEAFKAEFTTLVHQAGVAEMFDFRGVQNGEAKWQMYADADSFIFPTHHPTETFGLVLIEAMAFGLPIITTRWRGVPHVVGDSGCATLCDINAPDQYADALEEIFKNPDKKQQMGEAALKHYKAHYTREKFVGAMEEALRAVL